MSRLIDADALKESIQRQADILRAMGNEVLTEYIDVIQTGFCQEIDNAPTIEPQKWIPVSEKLPDIKENHVSEPCIVYCENGAYGFAELEENIFGQVGWDCEREDDYHEPLLGNVIAWMPLPEPWKGEEE